MVRPPARLYLDSSALVKLVITEPETVALRSYIGEAARIVSSRVAAVEIRRVVRRQAERDTEEQVGAILEAMAFVELDVPISDSAGAIPPPSLRSLDAIHLASAVSVGDGLDGLVTYDQRLASAAVAAGLRVVSPV